MNSMLTFVALHFVLFARSLAETVCQNGGTFLADLKTCLCNYSWTGAECSHWKHHMCYFDDGYNYRGFLNFTKSGKRCVPWTTGHNNNLYKIGENGIGEHNYCRNPDKDPMGLWCYLEGDNYMEHCNATQCPEDFKIVSNFTTPNTGDREDFTVRFLFGPLFAAIGVGVIVLIMVIVTAEYFRHKNAAKRSARKAAVQRAASNPGEGVEVNAAEEESRSPGGAVTVNIDTGEVRAVEFVNVAA